MSRVVIEIVLRRHGRSASHEQMLSRPAYVSPTASGRNRDLGPEPPRPLVLPILWDVLPATALVYRSVLRCLLLLTTIADWSLVERMVTWSSKRRLENDDRRILQTSCSLSQMFRI